MTGRRHYLVEVIPPGPNAAKDAEKARTRLLSQVDEKRNPRTRATVNQLLDRWLSVLDVEASTRRGYVLKIDRHIRPVLGRHQVAKLDAELLEHFYAALRKCRLRCGWRRGLVDHRTALTHSCDRRVLCAFSALVSATCRRYGAATASDSVRGARAMRWKWIAANTADQAEEPALPNPPSPAEAARIVTADIRRIRLKFWEA